MATTPHLSEPESPRLAEIERNFDSQQPSKTLDDLIDRLQNEGSHEQLFDALLLRARWDLDLPVCSPTGFHGVPDDKRPELERRFIAAARDVGHRLLNSGDLIRAWAYFRTIGEPEPVTRALDAIDPAELEYEQTNELIEIAIQDGANRLAGLRILLATHGTCNTVTMTDQVLPLMTPDERRGAAAMLVRDIYDDLRANLARVVSEHDNIDPDNAPIHELIAGRDWLFQDASYHIDVSHLHATVRFARALTPDDPELEMAIELAEYGGRLDPEFHFPADAPFDEYYPAHKAFLSARADRDRSASLAYFRDRLANESDERDQKIVAYVFVDLLTCCGRQDEAAEIAARHLADLEEPGGFSFSALCHEARRWDLLRSAAESAGDPIRYAAALIESARHATNSSVEQ